MGKQNYLHVTFKQLQDIVAKFDFATLIDCLAKFDIMILFDIKNQYVKKTILAKVFLCDRLCSKQRVLRGGRHLLLHHHRPVPEPLPGQPQLQVLHLEHPDTGRISRQYSPPGTHRHR